MKPTRRAWLIGTLATTQGTNYRTYFYVKESGGNAFIQELRFERSKDYSLCIVADGKLYLCNKEEFANSTKDKGYKFALTPLAAEANNVADLRKALEI